jgi:hypothetical protein
MGSRALFDLDLAAQRVFHFAGKMRLGVFDADTGVSVEILVEAGAQ